MRLYFTRHGESEANIIREISNRGYRHGLTEKGRLQAAALVDTMRAIEATRVYTSPLQRAVETAQILSDGLGIPYEITDALREFDCGLAEGRADAEAWALWKSVWVEWFERGNPGYRIEGGESYLDIQARFVPFVQGLVAEKGQAAESLVLIGHGGTYGCMLKSVLAIPRLAEMLELPFPNTGYVLAETRPEGLVCLEWCGVATI
jgi:probable phosphoglycerate mutase